MTRKLILLVLIVSLSTCVFAQGAACTQYYTFTLSGASSCTPGVQANQSWNDQLANLQSQGGGAGPNCSYSPNPYNSNCTYGECYSTAWTCKPASPVVGGCPADCIAGGPINLANGNTYIEQNDVRMPGLGGGLTLTRTWNSIWPNTGAVAAPQIGMFGTQWLSTYEEGMSIGGDGTMKYSRADGSIWSFASYGNPLSYNLIAPGNVQAATLTFSNAQSTPVWTVMFQHGEKRIFNGLLGGPLAAIIDRNGNTTSLTYDANNRLTTVTDPAGRHLYFNYGSGTSPYVASVTSDSGSGINVMYSYEECYQLSSGCGMFFSEYPALTQVTQADNTFVTFTYSGYLAITGVNDTNGKVLESHNYDACYGGLSSSRANGVEALSIIFSDAPYCGVP